MLNRLRFFFAWFITDRSTARIEHTPHDSTDIYIGKRVIHQRYGEGTIINTFHCRNNSYAHVQFKSVTLYVAPNTLKPW